MSPWYDSGAALFKRLKCQFELSGMATESRQYRMASTRRRQYEFIKSCRSVNESAQFGKIESANSRHDLTASDDQ